MFTAEFNGIFQRFFNAGLLCRSNELFQLRCGERTFQIDGIFIQFQFLSAEPVSHPVVKSGWAGEFKRFGSSVPLPQNGNPSGTGVVNVTAFVPAETDTAGNGRLPQQIGSVPDGVQV